MITYSLKYGDATEISEVQFEIMSTEQVRRISVVEITHAALYAKGAPHLNGMLDTRMGTIDRRTACATCGHDIRLCPGHFGHIELPVPLYHIGFMEPALKVLRCVCFFCSRILVSDEDLSGYADAETGKRRFAAIYPQIKQRRRCVHCDGPQPSYTRLPHSIRTDWTDVTFETEEESVFATVPLTARHVRSILHCMRPKDVRMLGFTSSHPREFIIETVVVPPPISRPSIHANEGSRAKSQDDLTLKLQDINKRCIEIRAALEPFNVQETTMDSHLALDADMVDKLNKLQLEVFSYMNSNVKAPKRQPNKSVAAIKSVGDRLKGKDGRIRGNLMGKRVDQSGRSVISPDACMDVDQVGVPESIALSLTMSERVSAMNIERLTARVRRGPGAIDGAESVLTKEGVLFHLEFCQALHNIRLEIGWVVERYLENNDPVIFNRQPSLHRMGMMSHRVKLVKGSTFKLNLVCANPYNADFDGDEMNLHVPQSSASFFEMYGIMAVPLQIISPASNKPVMGIVQDTLLGASLLTDDGVRLTRSMMMQLIGVLHFSSKRWYEMLPPPHATDPAPTWTGRQAFSLLLPCDFEYTRGDPSEKGALIIHAGQLLKGMLTKATLGTSSGSIIDRMYRVYGPHTTNNFMSDTQRLCNLWLIWQGFNVSVSDCIMSEKGKQRVREKIDTAVSNIKRIHAEVTHDDEWTPVEMTTRDILGKVLMNVGSIVEEELPSKNAIRSMVRAGSKGNPLNLSQIMGCVGQQNVGGRRTCAGMKRSLSNFPDWCRDVESRGFVRNSYCIGLTVSEYFFHAMGGREGLVDTAVKTAETGYMQRRLIKGMEDNRIEYDGSVRNACGCILSYAYGTDGMDPCKVERQNCVGLDWVREVLLSNFGCDGDAPECLHAQARRAEQLQRQVWDHRRRLRFDLSDQCLLAFNPRHIRWKERAADEVPASADELCDMVHAFLDELPATLITLKFAILVHMRASRLLQQAVSRAGLKDQIERIRSRCRLGAVTPGEMVGCIAAQSIGEPTTQMTLNSVDWHTTMALCWTGRTPPPAPAEAEVGAFVDALIEENPGACQIQADGQTIYLPLLPGSAIALSPDEDGVMKWTELEAVTRHPPINKDGSDTLVEATTESGRRVIVTKGKSLLVERHGKLVEMDGDAVRIGDRVPIVSTLPSAEGCTHLDLHSIFHPTEIIFTDTIVEAMARVPYDRHSCQNGGFTEKTPYSRSGSIRVCDRPQLLEPGKATLLNGDRNAAYHLPSQIKLDREFGFFVGAYLAEGCLTDHQVRISNVDEAYRATARAWPDAHGIKSHVTNEKDQWKNNGTSISIMLHSTLLVQILKRTCGKLSDGKRVPGFAYAAPDAFVKGLLDGYLSGDGSVSKKQAYMYAQSRSRQLRDGVALLLARFGVGCKLATRQASNHVQWMTEADGRRTQTAAHGEKTPMYDFSLRADEMRAFVAADVSLILDSKAKRCVTTPPHKNVKTLNVLNDVRLEAIKALDEIPSSHEFVYDLTVAETRNMTATNGLCCRDTFHSAGIGSQLTLGVPRFKELIDLAKQMRTPSMQLFLRVPFHRSRRFAEELASSMIQTKLLDIVSECDLVSDVNKYTEDTVSIDIDAVLRPVPPDFTAEWIRFKLRRDMMMSRAMTPVDVAAHLTEAYGNNLYFVASDANALEWFMHLRVLRVENVNDRLLLNRIAQQLMYDTHICGMKKVTNATVRKIKDPVAPGVFDDRYMIETCGISITHAALCDAVDMSRISLNDINEVFNVFGAEATAAKLFEQIETTISFDGTYVDPRHVLQIVDTMMFEGVPMPLTRHGINRRAQNGPLARISFEETVDLINEAAIFSMTDTGRGVTQSVMTGQLGRMGTGLVSVRLPQATTAKQLVKKRKHLAKSRIHYRNSTLAQNAEVNMFRQGHAFRRDGQECERPFENPTPMDQDRDCQRPFENSMAEESRLHEFACDMGTISSERQMKYASPPRNPREDYVPPTPPRK